jgi:regulator of replication initiation timing
LLQQNEIASDSIAQLIKRVEILEQSRAEPVDVLKLREENKALRDENKALLLKCDQLKDRLVQVLEENNINLSRRELGSSSSLQTAKVIYDFSCLQHYF